MLFALLQGAAGDSPAKPSPEGGKRSRRLRQLASRLKRGDSMALAILISTEGGRHSATMIGANQQDALAALDAVHHPSEYRYLPAGSGLAVKYLARAWEIMEPPTP